MMRRPINMMQGGRVLAYDDGGPVPELVAQRPVRQLGEMLRSGAEYVAPGIFGLLRGDPVARVRDMPSTPGKAPPAVDYPLIEQGMGEIAQGISNFVGPGAGAKTAGVGLAAAIPMAARRAKLPMEEAARLARADEAGFLRNMPVYATTAPEGERIAQPAIRVGDRTFTGQRHLDAIDKAERHFGKSIDELEPMMPPFPDGFVTSSGRFVTRHEAADIASIADQMRKSGGLPPWMGLSSEGLLPGKVSTPGSRGAPAPAVAATHPGLPGGEGVWLALEPGAGTGAQLWHRAERTKRGAADVEGLSVPEIHATLRDAWEAGKEAVLLKNYTTPDGRIQNVLVVKDRAQLRDPKAKFDPAKRFSRDLSAALIPPVALGAAKLYEGPSQ